MKYLDVPALSTIVSILRASNETKPDRQIRVKLEAYTTKSFDRHTPSPRNGLNHNGKRANIFHEENDTIASSSPPNKKEILESSHEVKKIWRSLNPRKSVFRNLILTMNEAFTDYEFSSVNIKQFRRITVDDVMSNVKAHFLEMTFNGFDVESNNVSFLHDLRRELEGILGDLDAAEIYCYIPDNETEIDADPLSLLGNLWAFNYFFCNPGDGKVVLLACSCRQRKFSQRGDGGMQQDAAFTLLDQKSFYDCWDDDVENDIDFDLTQQSLIA